MRNTVKKYNLSKSISDAARYRFREWLEFVGAFYGVPIIAVNPKSTSQNCSMCGQTVVKSLSTRTHKFPHCGYTVDRDENAGLNLLRLSLKE
ncbi:MULTISPECIES: zinc ribbon domain-containing protein [unclassified Microcoleus]|uniref:zinc ribbon domain-containing protein n=1 Tax=unclassified Microcoleus TaxID=2642155 RepID=UPI00403FBE85